MSLNPIWIEAVKNPLKYLNMAKRWDSHKQGQSEPAGHTSTFAFEMPIVQLIPRGQNNRNRNHRLQNCTHPG